MTYLPSILCSLLLCVLVACSSPNNSNDAPQDDPTTLLSAPAAALYQQVGATHDTAMLMMGAIERTQMRLRKTLEYTTEAEKNIALQLLQDLQQANDAMMDWMHEFKSVELNEAEYQRMSEAEIITYLNQQDEAMKAIDRAMRGAIQEGQVYVNRYGKEK